MTEIPGGIWVRVSTGGQDEANQVPDIERLCFERGIVIRKRYELNDKSAFKGEQETKQQEALEDTRTGAIKVLVAWASDRVERRGAEATLRIVRRFREAGGLLLSVQEPWLGDADSDLMTAITGWKDNDESKRKRERVLLAFARINANGALEGRPPFGYTTAGEKYNRHLVPTDIGREYVPQIFQRVADGQSLLAVCQWLDSEGVKPNSKKGIHWSPKSAGQMIRCRTYVGQRQNAAGRTIEQVPPLVDAKLWRAANKRLDEATRGKRAGSSALPPALLVGALKCGGCTAPMYRVLNGADRTAYYRCYGHHPQRKGCGVMVRAELLDSIADEAMSADHRWVMETTLIPGENHEAEIEAVRLAIRDLGTAELSDDEYDDRLAGLRAERNRLTGLPATPDRYESVPMDVTYADLWQAADLAGRREILKQVRIHFKWSKPDPGDDPAVKFVREPIVDIAPLLVSDQS